MNQRPRVLIGKHVTVRSTETQPGYFTKTHRENVGASGVVHAVVGARGQENPLIKVKFQPGDRIVFFRLSELDVLDAMPPEAPQRHGERGSRLPER